MTTTTHRAVDPTETRPEEPNRSAAAPAPAREPWWVRLPRAVWNWLAGSGACLLLPTAVLAVGWTYRWMRRSAVRTWNRLAPGDPVDPGPAPGWLIRERGPRTVRNVLSPLWHNARIGVQGVFNSYVLTIPACVAWLFAWRFGWDNSFHKMYEQSIIGPSTWMLGNVLFVTAMLYVPLAQARQAVTGDWRAFYGFKVVWALLRRRPVRWVMLAAAYAVLSIPVYVLLSAPQFLGRAESLQAMTDDQLVAWLYRYYFYGSLFLFPAFFTLRVLATRLYAKALPGAVRRGEVRIDRLHAFERDTLGRLGLLTVDPPARRHPIIHAVGWTGSRFGRFAIGLAAVLLWLSVTLQIAISSFMNYASRRWLLQPLVQVPTITHIPAHQSCPPPPRDATDMGSSLTGA